ncbi:MAG: KH domain-containing protein [Gloeobacterales cyanobacterium]
MNSSAPNETESTPQEGIAYDPSGPHPDYPKLVRFLVEPLLDTPEKLVVRVESTRGGAKILIRLAFDSSDKGKVFGRGGRTIQAVRRVLEAAGQSHGQEVRLQVFE